MGAKKIIIATGTGIWKAGAFLLTWGGKGAVKGSVWVVKRVAVDPAKRKVSDWSVVRKTSAGKDLYKKYKEMIKNSQCFGCGKEFPGKNGKYHYCSTACAQNAATAFNVVEQVKIPDTIDGNDKSLYLTCGCNRQNLFHGSGCTANKTDQRVAHNVKWSQTDPRHMKPEMGPDQKPMTKREAQLEAARQSQQANPVKKRWFGGY